jgi:phosphatidylinositol glycan class M
MTTTLSDNKISCLNAFWFLNPLIINVSTRGNADSIVCTLVNLMLYFLLKKRFLISALFYGLSVHFKIYPILYALPLYLYIDSQGTQSIFKNFFTKNRILFTLVSGSTFILLTLYFYKVYGY